MVETNQKFEIGDKVDYRDPENEGMDISRYNLSKRSK